MTNKIKSDGWSTPYYELPEGITNLDDLAKHRNMSWPILHIFESAYIYDVTQFRTYILSFMLDMVTAEKSGHYEGELRELRETSRYPPYFLILPSHAREIQDLIEYKNMNFAIGNIFKACYRIGLKDGTDPTYDLNKIEWFATRELNRIKKD